MNQKIEIGCMVMLKGDVFPENKGLTGEVIAHEPDTVTGLEWKIRLAGKDGVAMNFFEGKIAAQEGWAKTSQLMRIDDPGFESERETEREDASPVSA